MEDGGVEVGGGGVEEVREEDGLGLQRPVESLRLRLAIASCPWT